MPVPPARGVRVEACRQPEGNSHTIDLPHGRRSRPTRNRRSRLRRDQYRRVRGVRDRQAPRRSEGATDSRGDAAATTFFGGSIGAYTGRHVFRHKTRKESFSDALFNVVVIQMLLIGAAIGWFWMG